VLDIARADAYYRPTALVWCTTLTKLNSLFLAIVVVAPEIIELSGATTKSDIWYASEKDDSAPCAFAM